MCILPADGIMGTNLRGRSRPGDTDCQVPTPQQKEVIQMAKKPTTGGAPKKPTTGGTPQKPTTGTTPPKDKGKQKGKK
jgi:hypothetical protein